MSRVLRLITLERRIMSRASGANGMTVRGLWTAPCMYPPLYPLLRIKPIFSRGEEAHQ
jgi:hypothetical protein